MLLKENPENIILFYLFFSAAFFLKMTKLAEFWLFFSKTFSTRMGHLQTSFQARFEKKIIFVGQMADVRKLWFFFSSITVLHEKCSMRTGRVPEPMFQRASSVNSLMTALGEAKVNRLTHLSLPEVYHRKIMISYGRPHHS